MLELSQQRIEELISEMRAEKMKILGYELPKECPEMSTDTEDLLEDLKTRQMLSESEEISKLMAAIQKL